MKAVSRWAKKKPGRPKPPRLKPGLLGSQLDERGHAPAEVGAVLGVGHRARQGRAALDDLPQRAAVTLFAACHLDDVGRLARGEFAGAEEIDLLFLRLGEQEALRLADDVEVAGRGAVQVV